MSNHKVFVYGTLRDGREATHFLSQSAIMQLIKGKNFSFPAVQLVDFDLPFQVVGNILEADDGELAYLDKYENVKSGLYERVKLNVTAIGSDSTEEVWAYIAGPALKLTLITSGDWLNQ